MARPKSDNPRIDRILIMLTRTEKESLEIEACQVGKNISGYARDILLERETPVIVPEPNKKKWLELSKTTSNLNQVVHALNSGNLKKTTSIVSILAVLRSDVSKLRSELLGEKK